MTPPLEVPNRGPLHPSVTLAMAMHAQAGVYAVLLGSGVSAGAGVPTGWGIVTDLVRLAAAAQDPHDVGAANAAADDPETWWQERHEGPLGYSGLLEQLASTPSMRQSLLSRYFEPQMPDEADAAHEEARGPSPAHRAIARLVAKGYIRVVVTTNFDRLMEQALAEEGVDPQVIARPEAVDGMKPLVHSPATIIKLHGDYRDVQTLNTSEELRTYPFEWRTLLTQVLDEYGLLAAGWSAEWDTALVQVIEDAPSRRYPLYWDQRSSRGDNAQRLLAHRDGIVVPAVDADELFTDLADRVEALERLSHTPLTSAMAIAQVKRYLPDPTRRIDLHDLVMSALDDAVEGTRTISLAAGSPELYQSLLEKCRDHTAPLLRLLATGVWHDDGSHDQLWVDVLQRLVDAATGRLQSASTVMEKARRYPALLALMTMGISSTLRNREGLLIRLCREVTGAPDMGIGEPQQAFDLLRNDVVLDPDAVLGQPRTKSKWYYPSSQQLKEDLQSALVDEIPVRQFTSAFHGVEYRISLLQDARGDSSHGLQAGGYLGSQQWIPGSDDGTRTLRAGAAFLASRDLGPWIEALQVGSVDELSDTVLAHDERLALMVRYD